MRRDEPPYSRAPNPLTAFEPAMTADDPSRKPSEPLPVPLGDKHPVELRIWRSEDILGGAKEVLIMHGDEAYRLRRTRLGKLILQK